MSMSVLESTSTTFAFPLYQVEIHKSSLLPNTYMNIHITVCTCTDTDGYTHPHLHTHGHVYTDTHRCTHTQMPAYTHPNTCKYICVHARAHTHICQQAEVTGLERKAGVEERGEKSQRRPPQCLTSLSGFAFDFQLLIFTSSVTTSKQCYCRCPGPRLLLAALIPNSSSHWVHIANGISLLIKFHMGSLGKQGRWQ